jgi:hypothetical protein
VHLFTKAVAGRAATTASFSLDVTKASRLWLIVADEGSSAPERNQASWADVELVGPAGTKPLSALTPIESSGLRAGTGPITLAAAKQPTRGGGLRVQTPSRLVYDIAGQGYTRVQGVAGIENADVGATLQPQIRFFIFDAEPDMDRLLPVAPGTPLPVPAPPATAAEVVDRIFWYALSRAPLPQERSAAEAALRDPSRPGRASAPGVADVLWAVLMKPEFQLVY